MNTKTQGPIEEFLDNVCYPDVMRDEMEARHRQGIEEEKRAMEEAAIWDDMKCTPAHWEQRTRDIAEQVDLEPVYAYVINQLNRNHIIHICAKSKVQCDANNYAAWMGEEFLKHLTDECNQETIGRLIKAAVQQAIDEEVSK